jgi:hypothetical protein
MNPRVFVTQKPKPNSKGWTPNLSPAAEYGAIHYVFQSSDAAFGNPDAAISAAKRKLESFDAEKDYVLWPNSDPAAFMAVILALAKKGVHKIQMLYWERKLEDGKRSSSEGFYSTITFNF